ncbi:unnamed protein product [Parnassius apollo]|uniref:(apollo) hypothetical protein n=1 Tax=Parnassius apollo TaxID=110799 RepID=A0A8S3Y7H0_PARAO|nr:unnamed protein product [Parnassius apollo]
MEARDGVQCTLCLKQYDFPCAGITEIGFRKLGDRKATCPVPGRSNFCTPSDLDGIRGELRGLSEQMSSLPKLLDSVKNIQADLAYLKTIKCELSVVKDLLDYVHASVDTLITRIAEVDCEIQTLQKNKEDVTRLEQRLQKLEAVFNDGEQRSRLNNIEIKGVPITDTENLFTILSKIATKIDFNISDNNINYIARVPSRNDKNNKSIIVSLHNRYLRDNFVAAARKCKSLTPLDIGLNGTNRIFINDHLTVKNKLLLNKTKALAKERDFSYVWVKNCKILVRKNTSPVHIIKTELDLRKIV